MNILRPFARHLAQSAVLELGAGCGAITRYLGELGANVVAVEGSQRRASIAAERCRDLSNVTILCDRLQDLPFEAAFDVVTLVGVLEYAQVYVTDEDPVHAVLTQARKYLKPDGMLIVAIENQLGLKYFAGAPEDHGVGIMAGINDGYRHDSAITFGHKELSDRLLRAGFAELATYLPFPDYKMPTCIVHPAGQGESLADWNLATLLSNSAFYDRQPISQPLFSLERAWPLVARNGLLTDLANSLLLVAKCQAGVAVSDASVLASYYSPKRAAAYSRQIDFCLTADDSIEVRHRSLQSTLDSFQDDHVISEPYLAGRLQGDLLQAIVQQPGWKLDEVVNWANAWLQVLKAHLLDIKAIEQALPWSEYADWLPENYLDALPRNLIMRPDGSALFIDLEWQQPHPIPLLFVLYRGLLVSFHTLTSVAEPEDTQFLKINYLIEQVMSALGFSMSAEDYARCMPMIERVSRQSLGQPESEYPLLKPTDDMMLRVRQASMSHDWPSTTLTLYWRTAETGFNENNTLKRQYALNGEQHAFSLALPNVSEAIKGLRFDIAGRVGCFFLHELSVITRDGETIWSFDVQQIDDIAQLQHFLMNDQQACLISTGNDPRFELVIPPHQYTRLAGARVQCKLVAFNYGFNKPSND